MYSQTLTSAGPSSAHLHTEARHVPLHCGQACCACCSCLVCCVLQHVGVVVQRPGLHAPLGQLYGMVGWATAQLKHSAQLATGLGMLLVSTHEELCLHQMQCDGSYSHWLNTTAEQPTCKLVVVQASV